MYPLNEYLIMQYIIVDEIHPLGYTAKVRAFYALGTIAEASGPFLQFSKSGFPKPVSYLGIRQPVQRAASALTP